MADNKKYYYLKLKEDFFDSEDMKLLQGMPDGYIYSDILLKLYLQSLRQEGRLMYRGIIPYTSNMIATVTKHQQGTVEKAMKIFEQMGFIEILDNGAIYMMDIQNFIGQSSSEADRRRAYRNAIETEKLLLLDSDNVTNVVTNVTTNDGQMSDKCLPENRDKRIENRDKRIENNIISVQSPDRQGFGLDVDMTDTSVAGHVRPSLKAGAGPQSNEVRCKNIQEPEAAVEAIVLNDGSEWRPSVPLFEEYVRLYPKVDVREQFSEMRAWCISNPANRKTRRGITRFVNGWLSRAQDRGGKNFRAASNGFNQFQKNDYDISDIERKFLANGSSSE